MTKVLLLEPAVIKSFIANKLRPSLVVLASSISIDVVSKLWHAGEV